MSMRTAPASTSKVFPALVLLSLGAAGIDTPAEADVEGLAIHGFADTYYTSTTQHGSPSGNSGFMLGNLDLYIAPSFTDHIRAIMEDVVEFDDWHPPGESNGQPAIDIERLQVGYVVSNDLTVWIGRFHTPYGYWNTAYHHGAQLQPTVMRPQFLAFEDHGGILPAHMDGIWLTGHHAEGPGRITYDVYFGNGQRILDGALDMQNEGNADSHTAYGGRFGYEFRGGVLDSLWVGVHGVDEEVDNFVSGIRTDQTDVKILGGFLHWTPGDWEISAEYYGFDNRTHDESGPSHSSKAWYAEANYTFFGRLTPLVRAERDSLSQHDGYFQYLQGGQSYTRNVIGVRYDLTPQTALKLDANHTKHEADIISPIRDGGQSYNELHFQVAVRF